MKSYLLVTLVLIWFLVQAQTLVNLSQVDTLGHPTKVYEFASLSPATGGDLILVYNGYATGTLQGIAIVKFDNTFSPVWEQYFNGDTNNFIFATGAYVKNGSVYVAGVIADSAAGNSDFYTMRMDEATGDTLWTASYAGSWGGYDISTAILADDTGNVYVTGTEQTGYLDSRITVVKYDSTGSQLFTGSYDSLNMFDGAVDMAFDPGKNVLVTGFSGTGFGSWDFVTTGFNPHTGVRHAYGRSGNGNGAFSHPVAIRKDFDNNLYVAGTSAISGSNTDIKLIKYDTLFHEVWVRTFGDSILADQAVMLQWMHDYSVVLCGTVAKANGGKDIVILKYDLDGNLLWSRNISAPNPTQSANANDLVLDNNQNVYVTGNWFSGSDTDLVTASYDPDGNMRWFETYGRASGTHEHADGIAIEDDNLVVFISSKGPSDTLFMMLVYQTLDLSKDVATDSFGNPLYLQHQIILKFNKDAVKVGAVNKKELNFGELTTFLEDWAIDSLEKALPFNHRYCKLGRIFNGLKTTDTISVSRLGEPIPIPDFWSTFLLVYDFPVTEQHLCDTLNRLFPFVEIAELDGLATLLSTAPTDYYYSNSQYSLHPQSSLTDSVVDINVEPAWNYTTGKPYIKVGVFDSGILKTHSDFYGSYDFSSDTGTNPIVQGGWDYVWDKPLGAPGYAFDYGGHGTAMAGIIAAGRNNSLGISGIAGGDSTLSPGVPLYGFRLFAYSTYTGGPHYIASVHNAIKGLVEIATETPDSSYGYGIQVLNNSYKYTRNSDADTARYFSIDSNWSAIIDAYHYVNRNKVIMPCAAGNDGDSEDPDNPQIELPARFDDDWVLAVGG